MKQRHLFNAALFALTAFFSCATTGGGGGLTLEQGIAQIARDIEAGLPAGTRIAAVNFESPSAWFSDYVLGELQGVFVNNKRLVVIERSNLEILRDEQNFQMSGEVSDESAASLGKFIGAPALITGSLTDIGGGSYRFRFNAIDVETAVRKLSPAVTIERDTTIAFMLLAETAPPPARVPARPDPALATAYFNAGFAHYEAKRYTEAVAEFTRALEVKKDDAASLYYRVYSYYYLKDYDRSIADVSRMIQLELRNADHYLLRSAAYVYKGEYDRAIADCTEAIRLNPNLANAYYNRGLAYGNKGEHDRAIADYTEAIRLNPNLAEAYNGRGNAYGNKGEYDRAIADFNQAIRLNPNDAYAYNNRGNAYYDKGEYDRAIADFNQAIRLNPDYAYAYFNRGNAYYDKGEYDRAIADFNQALRVNPNYADAYFNRGVAYNDKEDYARARADWEKALQIDPNDGEARDNLESLRRMGYLTPVPEEVNNAYINASDNVLIGIGTYKIGADTSKMNTGMIFAQTRAKADISRQLDAIVNIMMTDYAARSEITPEAALSFQERVAQTIARADLRDAKVVMANTDSNGLLWVVMEFNKQAAMAELNQAVAAGKLAVPATAAFDTQRYIDAVFSKNAGGGPVPVGE